MFFRSLFNPLKSRTPATDVRRSPGRPKCRPRADILEDRCVPAAFLETDATGDFLPGYTGPQEPGLDVVSYEAVLVGDHIIFAGELAGPIAPMQALGGLYIIGVDRGTGTPRFAGRTPEIGPNVLWDSVVRVNPDGTGLFNNIIAGVITPLTAADITISGNEFTARVPVSVMLPSATRPPEEWTYNLWPRNSAVIGNNAAVPDLAPDDGNAPVRTVAPAQVAGMMINDGVAQRSMVNSVTITFDGSVTLDSGAFALSGQDGSTVEFTIETSEDADGRTVAVLNFAGADGGSLADGSYTLTIRADRVHDRWGQELDGDGDGSAGGDWADGFHRLFGDSDGDGDTDHADLDAMLGSFLDRQGDASVLWYFDYDADGDLDGRDMAQFNQRRH